MSFKTIAGGFNGAFWWYGPLSEDQENFEQIYQNYLVTLKCNLYYNDIYDMNIRGQPSKMSKFSTTMVIW